MPDEKKMIEVRPRLVLLLGIVLAVFFGVLIWRSISDRRYAQEQAAASAVLRQEQASLARRLAAMESLDQADKAAIEQKITDLNAKQQAASAAAASGSAPFDLNKVMPAIVELVCIDNGDKSVYYTASGTVVDKAGVIVTNQHVLKSDNGTIIRYCGVGFTTDLQVPPKIEYVAAARAIHNNADLAILQITERLDGKKLPPEFPFLSLDAAADSSKALQMGDAIYIGGYPGIGAETFTFTQGVVSGRVGDALIKTSALVDSGTSGGAALDAHGSYVGVPTAAARGDIGGSLGFLISADVVDKFLVDYYAHRTTQPPGSDQP